ncbi:MAG: hypothetical protein ACOCQX_01430 [Candidatus Nanoarchaeia archaeon]
MSAWQKGAFYAALFTIILSVIFSVILIVIDIILKQKGLPHMCFAFTDTVQCSFKEAILTRFRFMFMMIIIFTPIVSVFGGLIGYAIDKTKIE